MRDQVLDEDEILRLRKTSKPSFWSDFRYFVWSLMIGLGISYLAVFLIFAVNDLSYIPFQSIIPVERINSFAINDSVLVFPLTFMLMGLLVWYFNQKNTQSIVLKYVYSFLGILIIWVALLKEYLDRVLVVSWLGGFLAMLLIAWSIFMLRRQVK